MAWYNPIDWFKPAPIEETQKAFKPPKEAESNAKDGEGMENPLLLAGRNVENFNQTFFYKRNLGKINKLNNYRSLAENYEIEDVIEDAVVESTRLDSEGETFHLKIHDEKLNKNKNITNNLEKEFNTFISRLDLENNIEDYFEDYYIDSECYFENVINKNRKSEGILYWKKLPPETMDILYTSNGKLEGYVQYLKMEESRPKSLEDADRNPNMIAFYPDQVSYISYGNKKAKKKKSGSLYGYLEKAIKPFNQLSMLETSVIIYRIVRAPERFVFKIDVGNMPREKAQKFVEKMKKKLTTKETFDTNTGKMKNSTDIMSMTENFFLPTSSSGRGSDVETIGGNSAGFSELDDIYYFQKKLFKALKYPISRVQNAQEGRSGDNLFPSARYGEIPRDEVKWSIFLEKHQNIFCGMLKRTFFTHLKLKGYVKQYGLEPDQISIKMNCPNNYAEQVQQQVLQAKFENFMNLSNEEYMSKSFLMKRYLEWDDETIKENSEGLKKDKELGFVEEGGGMF